MAESAAIAQPYIAVSPTTTGQGKPISQPMTKDTAPLRANIADADTARPHLSERMPPMTGPAAPVASAMPPAVAAVTAASALPAPLATSTATRNAGSQTLTMYSSAACSEYPSMKMRVARFFSTDRSRAPDDPLTGTLCERSSR